MIFRDRTDAGQQLAKRLVRYRDEESVVMAIPRGGVVVGHVVASALDAPLDVVVPRKLGAPEEPELAIGAVVTWGNAVTVDEATVKYLRVTQGYLDHEIRAQTEEINRRLLEYRGTLEPPDLHSRVVILVDDGIATGQTMLAAVRGLRSLEPARIIVATPVSSEEAKRLIGQEVDEFVCLATPTPFMAVGRWYQNFEQVTDEEVISLLQSRRDDYRSRAA